MRFSDEQLAAAQLSDGEIKMINQMSTGGSSGGAGYSYEDYFAVYLLLDAIQCIINAASQPTIEVTRQGKAAVDDIIRKHGKRCDFFQLKTSESTTWTAENGRLTALFRLQKKLCAASNIEFTLSIVTPSQNKKRLLQEKAPAEFGDVLSVVHFPSVERRPEFWQKDGPAWGVLPGLMAHPKPQNTHFEHVVTEVFNCWYDTVDSNGYVSANAAYSKIASNERVPIRAIISNVSQADMAIITHLQSVGVRLQVDGGFCHWTSGFESGEVGRYGMPAATRLFQRLAEKPPMSEDEFMEAL